MDNIAVLHGNGLHEARLTIERDIDYLAFTSNDAAFFRVFSQKLGVGCCVKMVSIIHGWKIFTLIISCSREFTKIGSHSLEIESLDRAFVAISIRARFHGIPGDSALADYFRPVT